MTRRQILGIVVGVVGIASLCASQYIMKEVDQGKAQISDAQKKVNKANSLFSLTPKPAEEVGEALTGAVQKKINKGQAEVDYYESLANGLKVGGIALLVIGGVTALLGRKKRRG